MRFEEYFIIFPEGDVQEIQGRLRIGELVDLNGNSLSLPLADHRIIAFKVASIRILEERNATEHYHRLELVSTSELKTYVRH
jgi:hypothetical protein